MASRFIITVQVELPNPRKKRKRQAGQSAQVNKVLVYIVLILALLMAYLVGGSLLLGLILRLIAP